MFIANRLYVDFGQQATSVILKAAINETDQIAENLDTDPIMAMFNALVRGDMLYYLVQSNDTKVLGEVANWQLGKWRHGKEVHNAVLPHYYLQLLSAFAPGRSTDETDNSWANLQQEARARIEEYRKQWHLFFDKIALLC